MKTHTNQFKENIKKIGRELDSKITYTINNVDYELGSEELNSIELHYEADILKSVMRQLDIDSNIEIPLDAVINYKFGIKTKNFGNKKNLLPNTQKESVTDNGITFAYNDDGTYLIRGRNLGSRNSVCYLIDNDVDDLVLEAGTYYSIPIDKSGVTLTLYLQYEDETYEYKEFTRENSSIQIPSRAYIKSASLQVENGNRTLFMNYKVYPIIASEPVVASDFNVYGESEYEYLNFGNYIVSKVEKQEDTLSYKITCYDKMLYSMTDYEKMDITYPITIRDYINAICENFGLTFKNANDTFANYDKEITNELFLDENGNDLGYTFRDVLDQLAEVTASTICINEEDDELEIRYINDTPIENDVDVSTVEQKTENGVTCTYDSTTQEITFNGTATEETYFEFSDSFIASYKNEQYFPQIAIYYVSGNATGGCYFEEYDNRIDVSELNENNPMQVMRPSRSTNNDILFFTFEEGAVVDNFKVNIIVNDEVPSQYEIRDTIDEDFFKDVNVTFGEKFGPINSIVLSRSAESDNIYLQNEESVAQNGLTEIKISENQFMNFNNRDEFLPDILNQLDGLEYYINDYSSPGICYYNVCDKYDVLIGDKKYSCIMFNDDINVTQGLEEDIHTERPLTSETDYKKADKTDRKINKTTLIVDKQQGTIEGLVSEISELNGVVNENFTQIYQDITNVITNVQTSGGTNLLKNSVMFAYNEKNEPDEWDFGKTTIVYNNEQVLYSNEEINVGGVEGLSIQSDTNALNAGSISAHSFTLKNCTVRQKITVTPNSDETDGNYYTFSTKIKKNVVGNCYVRIYNTNEEYRIDLNNGQSSYYSDYAIQGMFPTLNYFIVEFYGDADSEATFTDNMFNIGEYTKQWTQANGEIMNTQVNVNINGVLVKSAQFDGNYTIMSPLEFAGYANVNGTLTKVFTLNNDVTEVEKLEARKQIQMPPIKIVPITSGNMQGWAFVEIDGGGV